MPCDGSRFAELVNPGNGIRAKNENIYAVELLQLRLLRITLFN
jgi:hypothetical protein